MDRPPKGTAKLFAYLLPAEVLALLASVEIAIGRRVLYALAVYTGLRKSSLMALKWKDVDITHAMLAALITKNGVPQLFEIPAGLVNVLRAWRARCGAPADGERVVQDVECGSSPSPTSPARSPSSRRRRRMGRAAP
ncbi:tyrosine-type recombinase/integrase [Sorangium sp. So ce426]|uniref:tyrosine-type recombinase/integrase n=1 Tax=Sorangium sp. So ce426 TaxID=3133312 RepID=UPI003F5AF030